MKFAYVSTANGRTEFEIHGAECSHLKRIRQNVFADVSIVSATSAKALVDSEVVTYTEQDQGWTHSDFRIMPCAKGTDIPARLEELRETLRNEDISMGELAELAGLADEIDPSDVELLEAAGVPEHPSDDVADDVPTIVRNEAGDHVIVFQGRQLGAIVHGSEPDIETILVVWDRDGEIVRTDDKSEAIFATDEIGCGDATPLSSDLTCELLSDRVR